MNSPAAAEALAAQIAKTPNVHLLRDLAELGPAVRSAASLLVELLSHPDWEIRSAAARALGYVGSRDAVGPLVGVLGNQEDWQLVLAAAGSLGRLGDAGATGALERLAGSHWYPPVRDAARAAMEATSGRSRPVSPSQSSSFASEFFAYRDAWRGIRPCLSREDTGPGTFDPQNELAQALATLGTYEAVVVVHAFGPKGKLQREEKKTEQKPGAALKVKDGWLLGGNRGEWGGELVFVDQGRHQSLLLDDNIHALARLGPHVAALGGLAHLSLNRGLVYQVVQDSQGKWSAHPWRVLPGAPRGSSLQSDGRWLIHTAEAASCSHPGGHSRWRAARSCAEC